MSAPDRKTSRIADDLKSAADATIPRAIDIEAVLSASRGKRRARRTAIIGGAGAAAAVLIVGGLVLGLQGGGLFTSTTADSSRESGAVPESAPEAPDDATLGGAARFQAAAGAVNRCGAPVIEAPDAAAPLTAALVGPASVDPGTSVAAEVVLTNDTDATVTGEVRTPPSLAVDEGGVVVWRTADAIAFSVQPIELGPGESITLPASFETRRCEVDDEPLDVSADDLPALDAATYRVSAVVEFAAGGSGAAVAIVSPGAEIAVR